MKNIVKLAGYSLVALTSVAYTNVSALKFEWSSEWTGKVGTNLKGIDNGGNIGGTIQTIISYLLGFLALIAVIFAIYGGFQILTAGWDEEKVKKGKTTLINALLGIFVIWISWALVSWILQGLGAVWGGGVA